ncbi:MAG: aldehyde dehydrogenase family protein [Methylotenera sp.]|nr:aldehyde dehydrogenase family protein [Oligoflexia bacterium]
MELGGTDAFIVLDDADLEKTIPWAVWGRMYNGGQTCCASKRFTVAEEIADKFLAKFKSALENLQPGDPMDEKTSQGPLSTEPALLQLLTQVDRAVAKGAKVIMGGKRLDRPGSYMQTTILTDVRPENPAYRDEFFGPVAMFFRVKDEAAAIALANDSDFGLGGSVFTQDVERGKRVVSKIETGMMFINNLDWADATVPGCDTFLDSPTHNKETGRIAGVGACKVSACTFNQDYECTAASVEVGFTGADLRCLTYRQAA